MLSIRLSLISAQLTQSEIKYSAISKPNSSLPHLLNAYLKVCAGKVKLRLGQLLLTARTKRMRHLIAMLSQRFAAPAAHCLSERVHCFSQPAGENVMKSARWLANRRDSDQRLEAVTNKRTGGSNQGKHMIHACTLFSRNAESPTENSLTSTMADCRFRDQNT